MLLLAGFLFADDKLNISGYIHSENRLQTNEQEITWNENRLNLQLEGGKSNKYHFFSEVRLRGLGFPNVNQTSDLQLQEKSKVYRWGLEFREAYVDLYGFALENLDVRIGRQIVSWGTGDAFNPTSNISPDDLEDIYNFGERLGINAFNGTYYLNDNITLNGVFIPLFTPATLPIGDFSRAFSPQIELPPGLSIGNLSDEILLPKPSISESSQYAIKIMSNLLSYDMSLSYFKGRDDFPLISKVELTPIDLIGTMDISTVLQYPEIEVIGGDFAGSIASVGIWGEGALTIPKELSMTTISPSFINPGQLDTMQTVALENESYFKYVLGSDYTFKNGMYLNTQFIHGFFHERGKDALNDYFSFRLEKNFFNGELKVIPVSGAIVINNWDDAKNNYGLVYAPELIYYFSDNVDLSIGAFILDGKGESF
jgi:hypothetical protein